MVVGDLSFSRSHSHQGVQVIHAGTSCSEIQKKEGPQSAHKRNQRSERQRSGQHVGGSVLFLSSLNFFIRLQKCLKVSSITTYEVTFLNS